MVPGGVYLSIKPKSTDMKQKAYKAPAALPVNVEIEKNFCSVTTSIQGPSRAADDYDF